MPKRQPFDIGTVVDTFSFTVPEPEQKPSSGEDDPNLRALLATLINASVRKEYVLRLDLMSSGHVRAYKGDRLMDPLGEGASAISDMLKRAPELFDILPEVLTRWGFPTPGLSEAELIMAEESMYRTGRPGEAAKVSAQFFDAQIPFFSTLFNRVNDGFYAGIDPDLLHGRIPDFWRATKLPDMVTAAFGFQRKDLAKLVASASPTITTWMSMFTEYLTEDQMVRAFREMVEGPYSPVAGMDQQTVDDVMTSFTHPTSRFNLALNRDKRTEDMYFDNGDMQTRLPGDNGHIHSSQKIRGWNDVARYVMAEYAKTMGPDHMKPSWLSGIKETSIDGYDLIPLESGPDLIQTGNGMSVCVGRMHYMHHIEARDIALVRLDKGEQMIGLAEMEYNSSYQTWELNEFKGHGNAEPPSDFNIETLLKLVNMQAVEYNKMETDNEEEYHEQLADYAISA